MVRDPGPEDEDAPEAEHDARDRREQLDHRRDRRREPLRRDLGQEERDRDRERRREQQRDERRDERPVDEDERAVDIRSSGSSACVQMNERPNFCIAGQARRRPCTRGGRGAPSTPSAATSGDSPGRRRRPAGSRGGRSRAGAAGSGVTVLMPSGRYVAWIFLICLNANACTCSGSGWNSSGCPKRLAARDGPVDHLPQLRRLGRARRDDHVGERRDRVGERVALRRVDDRERAVARDLLRQRRSRRLDAAQARASRTSRRR